MRKFLWILVVFIILIAILIGFLIYCSQLSYESKISTLIQFTTAVAAVLTALIALLISYPQKRKADIEINCQIDKNHIEGYEETKLNDTLKEHFKDYNKPLKSHRIIFTFKNNSDFDLKKPIFSIKLPIQFAHPDDSHNSLHFRSNIFNSSRELFLLNTEDYYILSNNILPYMNKDDDIKIWVRMIIDEKRINENEITIFVNCENADGITKKIVLPKV